MSLLSSIKEKRWVNLAVVNLRILLGFAFVPAGLKKVLDQPFTDPAKTGAFHEFLHAFHATGFFYQFVGAVQLAIAVLLMTQRFAFLGALMALPVFTAIGVFCWSTGAHFTALMVTLMWLGAGALVVWDLDRWRGAVAADQTGAVDLRLWQLCGAAILALYLAVAAANGGVYRPRGVELDNPAFWLLPLIALFPIAALVIEHRRR